MGPKNFNFKFFSLKSVANVLKRVLNKFKEVFTFSRREGVCLSYCITDPSNLKNKGLGIVIYKIIVKFYKLFTLSFNSSYTDNIYVPILLFGLNCTYI